MNIQTKIPLARYTTMKLGGPARFIADVTTPEEVASLYARAAKETLKVFVIGGGSNIIAHDEGFDGIILHMRIPGFTVVAEDASSTTVTIGAGEIWDSVVQRLVDMGLTGVEAMSGIPGTAGATPVQNVGAYGQEVSDTLVSLDAYDTETSEFVTLSREDCNFSYRSSMFREDQAGRYIIVSITLKLSKNAPQPPFYDAVQAELDRQNIQHVTPKLLRDIVLTIRANKLPDPVKKPNSGSFFKNVIVEKWQFDELRQTYDTLPAYEMADGRYKLPTGWLIERAGLKGELRHGIRIHEGNALVLINESAQSYADLAATREEIIDAVRDTFGLIISQEPLEL